MGESADNSSAEEEQGIAGELDRSDIVNVSNITNDPNYDAQFTADSLQDRGLPAQNFMSPENFAQTTQGGASDPLALDDGFYNNISSGFSGGAPLGNASPNVNVLVENLPSLSANNLSFGQAQGSNQIYPDAILRLPEIRNVTTTKPTDKEEKEGEDLAKFAAQQAFSAGTASDLTIPDISGDLPNEKSFQKETEDFSDFNFSRSNAAQGLRDRMSPTSGIFPLVDLVLGFPARNQINRLDQGFVPNFDEDGNITGTKDISFGSNQTVGLLGQNPDLTNIYGSNQNNQGVSSVSVDDNGNETVQPITNPMTGVTRCPDGYTFDSDLNACRLDTGTTNVTTTPVSSGDDLFFRRTALDTAPSNLPSGFNFDEANKRFTSSFAVNPNIFNRPPNLTGFTPFSNFRPFSK